jgi:hypothetical protein
LLTNLVRRYWAGSAENADVENAAKHLAIGESARPEQIPAVPARGKADRQMSAFAGGGAAAPSIAAVHAIAATVHEGRLN